MTIYLDDFATYLDTIEGLVHRGLQFESFHDADRQRFTIKLTGGY